MTTVDASGAPAERRLTLVRVPYGLNVAAAQRRALIAAVGEWVGRRGAGRLAGLERRLARWRTGAVARERAIRLALAEAARPSAVQPGLLDDRAAQAFEAALAGAADLGASTRLRLAGLDRIGRLTIETPVLALARTDLR